MFGREFKVLKTRDTNSPNKACHAILQLSRASIIQQQKAFPVRPSLKICRPVPDLPATGTTPLQVDADRERRLQHSRSGFAGALRFQLLGEGKRRQISRAAGGGPECCAKGKTPKDRVSCHLPPPFQSVDWTKPGKAIYAFRARLEQCQLLVSPPVEGFHLAQNRAHPSHAPWVISSLETLI